VTEASDEVLPVPAVELDRVTARYGSRDAAPALEGVSLAIGRGKVAALLGPNGAGKSTLLRVAAGLLVPAAGTVRVAGKDVGGMERRAAAREMAFVPQTEAAAAGFSVREVVAMGRAPHQSGWMRERAEDRAAIDEAIARCDLGAVEGRAVETLSGGEQRRVAVARALAARPRVLLLDEPGAFLDVRHRLEQSDLLVDLARRDHLACIVSMHDLDAAARVADHVVLLRDGRVVAAGPPGDVMTGALLRATFDADVDVGVHEASGRRYFVPLAPTALAGSASPALRRRSSPSAPR
jgi:iron complex transport system ATP-binding protein